MAKNTIKIKKFNDIVEEYVAAGDITPGHLVEITSAGTVQAHSTEAGRAFPAFALEDELQGNGISTDYEATDRVPVWIPGRGDEVYALLAANESVDIGDFLVSNADGTLKKIASDTVADAQVIGVATESAGSTSDVRLIVKII